MLAAFTLGYAIMQIPGGWLADRFGARTLLIASPLAWSIFTGLTGLASSAASLISIRVLFGLGEGASNGPSFKLVGDWFTSEERSQANGLYLTSLALGPGLRGADRGLAAGPDRVARHVPVVHPCPASPWRR